MLSGEREWKGNKKEKDWKTTASCVQTWYIAAVDVEKWALGIGVVRKWRPSENLIFRPSSPIFVCNIQTQLLKSWTSFTNEPQKERDGELCMWHKQKKWKINRKRMRKLLFMSIASLYNLLAALTVMWCSSNNSCSCKIHKEY